MKYTIEEIKEFLLEPSFYGTDEDAVMDIIQTIEDAIAHHEKLNKSNNGEGF